MCDRGLVGRVDLDGKNVADLIKIRTIRVNEVIITRIDGASETTISRAMS